MTTHETVNKLYAEIQTLLRKNLGAEGKGFFAMLKSVESKLSAKLVWELRLIGNIRNQVVHECLEPVPRYFEAICGEAIEGMRAASAALAPKTNSSQEAAETTPSPKQSTPKQQVPKARTKPHATNRQNSKPKKSKQPQQPAKPQPSSTKQQPKQ